MVEPALVRMLRAGRDEGRELDQALDLMARVFGRSATAERLSPCFTCKEVNIVAFVLAASRHEDAAVVWLDEHAVHCTDESTHR
jgi:hypothetical protein